MYRYVPLPDPTNTIRLVRFCRDPVTEPHRRLKLATFNLEEAPTYSAISYTWGENTEDSIVIDHHTRQVRTNCLYALQQVHQQNQDDWIWIDSICINQEDPIEKTEQVHIMWQIYAKAFRVYACVGPGQDNSQLLARVGANLDANLEARPDAADWLPWLSALLEQEAVELCSAFQAFAYRHYWSRLWIVQEMAAAQRVWVLCGENFISWHALDLLSEILSNLIEYIITENAWHSVRSIRSTPLEAVILFEPDSQLDVGYVFTNFGDFKCADPRDRLYGVLHLMNWPSDIEPLTPDYGKGAFDLALTMSGIVELFRVDDMLSAFQIDANHPQMLALLSKRNTSGINSNSLFHMPEAKIFTRTLYDLFTQTSVTLSPGDHHTTRCARLRLGSGGKLFIPLPRSAASPLDESVFSGHTASPENLSSLGSKLRQVLCGTQVVTLTCQDAQEGDILISFGQAYQGILLVVRKNSNSTYDVIGQGITLSCPTFLGGEQIDPLFQDDIFEARVKISLTSEDILVLIGQDYKDKKRLNHSLRLKRLETRPLFYPQGAVEIKPALRTIEP